MLYRFVRPIARIGLKIFFRKIYFSNADRVPVTGPIILAANHPTAYTEPCVLACFLPRPLHFIVRGNLFKGTIVIKLLRALHMLPVFRWEDGFDNIRNNHETLDYCYNALKEDKSIMILAEGRTKLEKRLRPIQKGTARMALGAMDKYNIENIQVIPVGVNYRHGDRFRSEVMIDFGEAMPVKDYFPTYQENPNKAFKALTEDLKTNLEKHVIIIDKVEDEYLVEGIFELERNDHQDGITPIVDRDVTPFQREMTIVAKVNNLSDSDKKQLEEQVKSYFKELDKANIKDQALVGEKETSFFDLIKLFLGFPLFLIGYLIGFIPISLATLYVKKNTVRPSFYASGIMAGSLGACFFSFLIALSIAIYSGQIGWILLVLLSPALGYFSLIYQEFYKDYQASRQIEKLDPQVKEDLLIQRNRIKSSFSTFNIACLLFFGFLTFSAC